MKRIRLFMAALAVFIGLGGAVPAVAMAASSKNTVCQALGSDPNCKKTPHGSVNLNHVIKLVINILSWVVGVTAVIMIIVSGFRYVTSGGDSNNIAAAKNTLIYAIVGLVVAASAQVIVKFVLTEIR